ncbi:arsinothricin resistance N-acetyltransferase ArsN1 family A [Peribacillus simplex]|uniref:GNAT family N-acetyltransferase n=1 Tax=Peribacillus simplex NBRC 15720 = DSM 1321 TaxID=1349754 RepID=A0A223EEZ9_9BACI|nr:arsinothricin resistance N-acetyltransferase ArsN1 family A [Peribacillus simplex]ASS93828.1 GNAT family N-acetyltransferase [Peribacillus simplex NBRC 15720 = DSM 1321]MEC1396762.1 arsinothricin resistance N-acetyltransferase ArsN1 [Peribacillus simplex]MED3909770.1 arsinothricin resistance N-acetyltransferase ArsN1 [Peribacillus simplex]CAH0145921.1 Putative phosphinothricin acetyltransferase YwnH [Peribacillus simplex]
MIIREAMETDIDSIKEIYNQGIEDRIATLETELKDQTNMEEWFAQHIGRYKVIVADQEGEIVGWASLNQYNSRDAYKGVADLSVYISRDHRGKGIGGLLLQSIEKLAKENDFNKIVLFTFPFNQMGQGLYKKRGYREVGVFKNQGILDGEFVDVMAMEKLL